MTNSSNSVTLTLLEMGSGAAGEKLLAGIAGLQLVPGQEDFVGDPALMAAAALGDPSRHPFVIVSPAPEAAVVGMGVLHVGAGADVGWQDPDGAVVLRGFMVDHRWQGLGYGSRATLAAVELARDLELPDKGVVLGVNERNQAGWAAYLKAGFTDEASSWAGGPGRGGSCTGSFERRHTSHRRQCLLTQTRKSTNVDGRRLLQ